MIAVLTLLLGESCTSHEVMDDHVIVCQKQQVGISLQMAVNSVASRKITSWDSAQQVNDMRLYLFRCPQADSKDGTYTYYVPQNLVDNSQGYYAVGSFDNQKPYLSTEHNGQFEEHTFFFTPILETGYYYKFLAVGRDDKYSDEQHLANPTFTANTTTWEDASISLSTSTINSAKNGNPLNTTELFVGKLQENDQTTGTEDALLVTDETIEFNRSITLRRAVAGLMFYVVNIPSWVEDNTTTDGNRTIFKPTSLTLEATALGTDEYLASKTATTTTPMQYQIVASIDLTAAKGWSTDEAQQIFTRPADEEKGWKENSYMSTNFMMPTLETSMNVGKDATSKAGSQKVTFYFHYTDGTHHHYDNVKLITDDGGKLVFPIEANHLYTIGEKNKTNNTPYDLKKYYPAMVDITLEIEPSFDKRHDFEVE